MSDDERPRSHERWAHLRFGVVGGLLASPPAPGELRAELSRLAEKPWRHPTTGELVRFSFSTVERWYYTARAGSNPVGVLRRKLREDSGRFWAITDAVAQALRQQYKEHPPTPCPNARSKPAHVPEDRENHVRKRRERQHTGLGSTAPIRNRFNPHRERRPLAFAAADRRLRLI